MTIASQTSRISYVGDGSTTAFAVPFYFAANADIQVYLQDSSGNQTLQVLGTNYNLSGATLPAGGTCTFTAAPASGYLVAIYRDTAVTQTASYNNNDPFPAKSHENALDKLTAIAQRTRDLISRAPILPDSDPVIDMHLPTLANRKNKLLGFDGNGLPVGVLGPSYVGGTDVGSAVVNSRAVAAVTTFSASIQFLITGGYATSGDGGGTTYKRGTGGGSFTDGGGVSWVPIAGAAPISVKVFGAKGDGATDDTAAMQAAHNTGRLVYYPAGTYLLTPTITIPSGGIVGDGPTLTILKSADLGTSNFFKYTGQWFSNAGSNAPTFHDFSLIGDPSKTNGAGIQVLPASGEASYLDFRNVHFAYIPLGIDFVAASLWKVIGCDFLAYTVAGIQVANTNNPDSGDSVISGCVFNNPFTTGSGVWQKSSGGLKIIGNKFLGGSRGVTLNVEGSTAVLLISGNSIENMAQYGISLSQGVAGKTFLNIAITGNEFGVGTTAFGTDATGFLSELVITGNTVNMGAAGSNACIFLNSVTDFYIGENVIRGNGGAGSSAINITSCTNGKIGINTYANLPTPLVVTSSPTVEYFIDIQSGSSTSATSGWSGLGTVFVGPATTVTFARPFLMAPSITDITITSGSANGALGGFVTSVTKTNFTYNPISSVTGIAATIYWRCAGVL